MGTRENSAQEWVDRIEAIGPGSLLIAIEQRLGSALRERVSAEDILQEAMVSLCTEMHRLEWRGPRQFRAWLLRVIDHRIVDESRRLNGKPQPGRGGRVDREFADAVARSTTPSRMAAYREQAAIIRDSLNRIPEPDRQIVCARVIDQRTLASIADELGLTVGAVRQRFRAGAELYQMMLQRELASRSGAASAAE